MRALVSAREDGAYLPLPFLYLDLHLASAWVLTRSSRPLCAPGPDWAGWTWAQQGTQNTAGLRTEVPRNLKSAPVTGLPSDVPACRP